MAVQFFPSPTPTPANTFFEFVEWGLLTGSDFVHINFVFNLLYQDLRCTRVE